MRKIAALFVSGRSIYKHMKGVIAYDSKRNALSFHAKTPAVAHPPCRCWSKFLRAQAKPPDRGAEMELGRWAVRTILKCGGVLEHPAGSLLFADMGLPMPNQPAKLNLEALGLDKRDFDKVAATMARGVFTIYVEQAWFGYSSRKATWVFVAGVPFSSIPRVPFSLVKNRAKSVALSSAGRSRSMPEFADWLCQIARLANQPGRNAKAIAGGAK